MGGAPKGSAPGQPLRESTQTELAPAGVGKMRRARRSPSGLAPYRASWLAAALSLQLWRALQQALRRRRRQRWGQHQRPGAW
jgi:hypothetical protein